MEIDAYMSSIRATAADMVAAAKLVGLSADVPTCPEWRMRDLMVHTGVVHRHKAETVRGSYVAAPGPQPEGPDGDVLQWFNDGVGDMLDVFAEADLGAPTWTWCAHSHSASWWVRRMAHETVIHAADAVIAAGGVPSVDPWLATDGVDEILDEMMIGGRQWGTVTPKDRAVTLETEGRRWVLRMATFSGTSPDTGTTHTGLDTFVYGGSCAPDASVRIDPTTLDLWLWGRVELPDDAVTGDRSLVRHIRTVAAAATS